MASVTSKIAWRYRIWIFIFLMVSWCSGLTFFALNRWVWVEGDFGPQKHPWQYNVLQVHGASAFMMMISYGVLLASHVPVGLRQRRRRACGLALVAVQGFMIFTAYLLYYAGEENRTLIGWAHAIVGFTFPFVLAFHVIDGIRTRKKGNAGRMV